MDRWTVSGKVNRPAYYLETGSASRVEVWRSSVQNRAGPAGPILPVLRHDPKRSLSSFNGKQQEVVDPGIFLLERTQFPSRSDVEALGNVVCAMLNRFPGDIDATAWNKPDDQNWRTLFIYWLRQWIEGIAFLIIFPNFDFTTLADSRWNSTGYFPNSRLLLEAANMVARTKHRSAATCFQFRFSDIAWVTNITTSQIRGTSRPMDQLLRINVASAPDMASLHPILAQVTTNQLYRPTVQLPGTFTADQIEVVCRVATIVR